ncbi:MAG TPA: pantetheine-phosphate adenylyltransferase [Ornithinimicrobium sp.]|uniref:pantetheine-phosphate adenylyltransferase n=1 Tax=Ornithinimicrobium sp. TaxID=1977084 RepID=UPI002B469BBD|nr:pantetheine-phosphate adenylyltransferase [Ornithinimicrobium sp.]HKJ10902.1 pantetheine-phosphate adenylyltransferase [Ornithinimicrobium sp.]
MTRRCVCPGSFDPVTFGHLDVIARASRLFDEVVVAVLHNPAKSGAFDAGDRVDLLQRSLPEGLATTGRVRVVAFKEMLLVDVCREVGATAVVKGVRGPTDYSYEVPMAHMNAHLSGVETVFLAGSPRWGHVSSSLVREVAAHGADVSAFVPEVVQDALSTSPGPARPS